MNTASELPVTKAPEKDDAFAHENAFYLTCQPSRMSKMIAHLDLYRRITDLPGHVVECGVFKGVSFSRFAMFRNLFEADHSRKLIGFDIFGEFPETDFEDDKPFRERFIANAGSESISAEALHQNLSGRGLGDKVELIAGDITQTVPAYVADHPELKVALLNLDTDIYEPALTILEHLYPRVVEGGVIILDDYGTFPGETKAIDEYFKGQGVRIQKFPYAVTPSYLIKGS